jgi:urease gamma subunit
MIIFYQIPIVDFRLFIDEHSGKLPSPFWPTPEVGKEFVRSFGSIKQRGKGGIKGWMLEDKLCAAKKAIRILDIPPFKESVKSEQIKLKCVARLFYFDGLAVGKFEIVFLTNRILKTINHSAIHSLIDHILKIPVKIHFPYGKPIKINLSSLAKHIAKLYLVSSSYTKDVQNVKNKDWVISGLPLMLFEFSPKEKPRFPYKIKKISLTQKLNMDIWHEHYSGKRGYLRLWFLKRKPGFWFLNSDARTLRLYLMRLNAEHESLTAVLKKIEANEITLNEDTKASSNLQDYINEATRRINQTDLKTSKLCECDEIAKIAYKSLDQISEGRRDTLLKKSKALIENIDIYNKLENFVNNITIIEGDYMEGDKIKVKKVKDVGALAVGKKAHIHDVDFTKIWNECEKDVNLKNLTSELTTLLEGLKNISYKEEHYHDMASVASAVTAAKDRDGTNVLKKLSSVGKWVLESAEKIGLNLAAEVIKKSLGY